MACFMECQIAVLFSTVMFGLLILYFLFLRKKNNSLVEEVFDAETGIKRVRIYEGNFTRGIHDKLYLFSEAMLVNAVFIESMVPLPKSDVVKALASLAKIHPLLRMRCGWEGKRRFMTEMKQFSEREVLFTAEENTDDWIERFEQDLQQGFDLARGPLWRVTSIKQSFDSSSKKYNIIMLFTFHHSISDEISVLNFVDQFADILNQIHSNNFVEENLQPLPLLPPLLDLIKHHTHLSWWEKIAHYIKNSLQSQKSLQYTLLDVFPPPILQNPSIIPRTHIIPDSLSELQTTCLVRNCKANKCTVTGALGSCLAVAIGKMLTQFQGEKPVKMTLGYPVNTRKGCTPVVNSNDFGLFIGIVFLPVTIPVNLSPKQYFWQLAQTISKQIKEQVTDNKQYGYCTMLQNGFTSSSQGFDEAKEKSRYAGRYPNFEITNCGSFPFKVQSMCQVKRVHFAVAQDIVGPQITLSSLTAGGQLHYTVVYSNMAVNEETSKTFSQFFQESIIELASFP